MPSCLGQFFSGNHDTTQLKMKGHVQMLGDLLKGTELAAERRNKTQAQMVRPINVCVVQTSSRGKSFSMSRKMF